MRSLASLPVRPHRRRGTRLAVLAGVLALARAARAEDAPPAPPPGAVAEEIVLREALRVESVGRSSRSLVHTDAVEADLVAGTWRAPRSGAELELPDGTMRRFTKVTANDTGVFEGGVASKGAYLSFRVPSDTDRVWLLHAVGHDVVYVNGEVRPGDPYGLGWLRLPVALRKGDNELLFRASRGRFVARLVAPPADVFLSPDDATLPDVRRLGPDEAWSGLGAVVVVNATATAFDGSIHGLWPAQPDAVSNRRAVVAPFSVAKVLVGLPPLLPPADATVRLRLDLVRTGEPAPTPSAAAKPGRRLELDVPVRRPDEVFQATYESDVDGSAQSFAVSPPSTGRAHALVLSLHGAGVEAPGQARSYGPRPFDAIVCPTNRRPYGFDWEDWGRWDAQDVLGLAWDQDLLDPARVYLTGHSMGGHGTWQLGVLFPDRFAAIAPSAGWRSFATYGGAAAAAPEGPVAAMLARAASPSDTTAYARNLATSAVYVLHGDADDNVPVAEARAMRELLAPIVPDLHAHEQPGAGHWWDLSDAPGADCVDWPPMWALFGRRRLPAHHEVPVVDFATPDPAVTRHCFWVEVHAQERSRVPSHVRIERVPGKRRFVGTTVNVRALALDVEHLGGSGPVDVVLDGTALPCPAPPTAPDGAAPPPTLRFERRDGAWRAVEAWTPGEKGGRVTGTFKAAFDRRFLLVVGTKGTPDEVAWAVRKARCDAETWYYRGNGATEIVEDVAYDAADARYAGRNVILYGHAEMNAAWARVLGDGPVTVRRGAVDVGGRRLEGDRLATLLVRPLRGDPDGLVGVVAGTGIVGLRLTERLPIFTSGVGIPDLVVLSPDLLTSGEAGLVAAGFFGPDWSVPSGEFAFR
jgi:dienelactone hydrolase